MLDLHGHTAEEALRRTDAWLRARRSESVRTVIVVTGRGRRSPGVPVLRSEVDHLLAGLKGTVVAAYEVEPHGGSFRIQLRRPDAPGAPAPAAEPRLVREAPPDLRRRAEEALSDLGIKPTPALLAAEIRRLLREGGGE